MKITLVEIEKVSDCETPELQGRDKDVSKSKLTTYYRAVCDGQEVAFVAVDRWPDGSLLVLYELFVPRKLRCQGYGSAVLTEVERMARKEGFYVFRVYAEPRDDSITREALIEWYSRRGYEPDPSVPGEMEKRIN